MDIRNYYAVQSHPVTSPGVYFFMTSVTYLASSGCGLGRQSARAGPVAVNDGGFLPIGE